MGAATAHRDWVARADAVAAGIRRRVLRFTVERGGGYMSQACSVADILAALYVRIMQLGPSVAPPVPLPFPGVPGPANPAYFTGAGYNGPRGPELDRFYLSPAHYGVALYAALVETGRLAPEGLEQFNADGSSVEMIAAEHSPGMEVTAGSLGQTISQAAGVAWARKRRGEAGRTWVLLSDGELQIGQTWEALQAMSFHGLDTMGVYVDVNGQQCDGRVEDVMAIEPVAARLEAFGARVVWVDGHDLEALVRPALEPAGGRPLVVLCRTDPCRCLPLLRRNAPRLHYLRFKSEAERAEYAAALQEMEEGPMRCAPAAAASGGQR